VNGTLECSTKCENQYQQYERHEYRFEYSGAAGRAEKRRNPNRRRGKTTDTFFVDAVQDKTTLEQACVIGSFPDAFL